jgi:S-formylglutathione hydrolase FrmB
MGGFGAVRLGLKYPQRFFSVWSHSGGFPVANDLPHHWHWTGNANDLDCYQLIDRLDTQVIPRLSFDCGTHDHLLESNRRFHAFLERRGIRHAYHEHPGGHDWDYWDAHVQAALKQHLAEFKLLESAS